jgi:polyribonucleotide nucleotidyltransferase
MEKALTSSRTEISDHAPTIETIKIPKDKIRDLIGPGGKTIRELTERFQVKIDIDDEGGVTISALAKDKLTAALTAIKSMFEEPEIGKLYKGTVMKIVDFGAFVKFLGEREGLVHVSEITGERIERVSDVLKAGQSVDVKVLGFYDRGKVKLTMRGLA